MRVVFALAFAALTKLDSGVAGAAFVRFGDASQCQTMAFTVKKLDIGCERYS